MKYIWRFRFRNKLVFKIQRNLGYSVTIMSFCRYFPMFICTFQCFSAFRRSHAPAYMYLYLYNYTPGVIGSDKVIIKTLPKRGQYYSQIQFWPYGAMFRHLGHFKLQEPVFPENLFVVFPWQWFYLISISTFINSDIQGWYPKTFKKFKI